MSAGNKKLLHGKAMFLQRIFQFSRLMEAPAAVRWMAGAGASSKMRARKRFQVQIPAALKLTSQDQSPPRPTTPQPRECQRQSLMLQCKRSTRQTNQRFRARIDLRRVIPCLRMLSRRQLVCQRGGTQRNQRREGQVLLLASSLSTTSRAVTMAIP